MAEMYTSSDGPPAWLKSKAITVFGFGAQGEGQAHNLKDSGCRVTVCLYPESRSIERAKSAGFTVMTDAKMAAKQTEIAVLLIPDSEIPKLWESALRENLPSKATLILAHGFSIHYDLFKPNPSQDVILVAPLGHGIELRQKFVAGSGIPAVAAVHQDASGTAWETTRAYAQAIGCARVWMITSTFKEETETDLFTEQTTIVGGLMELVRASFDTMVAAGYQPEIAYWCTLREIEGMAHFFVQKGFGDGMSQISPVAQFGSITRGPRVINDSTKTELQKILREIQSGKFLQELQNEAKEGYPKSKATMEKIRNSEIESTHKKFTSPL